MCDSRVGHVRDGELQGRSEVFGRGEDRTSEVRDVQSAVPGTECVEQQPREAWQGHGRTGVRQQRQDVPLVVSHVHGRLRHGAGDRDQSVGPVSPTGGDERRPWRRRQQDG